MSVTPLSTPSPTARPSRRAARRPGELVGAVLFVLVPVAAVVAWFVLSAGSTNFFLPPLSDILSAFRRLWLFDRVGSDVVPSLVRLAIGYGLSVLLGVGLGLAMGLRPRLHDALNPFVQFLRSLPGPAIIPLAIVVLGLGSTMKVLVIVLTVTWPILLSTVDGVRSQEPAQLEAARAYGIGGRERLRRIVLPAASPRILAGMRTSLAIAIMLMVISEMVAATNGIGYFVLQSQRTFAVNDMWAGILLLGLLGIVLNGLFTLSERRALRWHRERAAAARTS